MWRNRAAPRLFWSHRLVLAGCLLQPFLKSRFG
jgi:hypothetical protein